MKKIFTILKMLVYGIPMVCGGSLVALDVQGLYSNIIKIATGSGWPVVTSFIFALVDLALIIVLLIDLGMINMNHKQYMKHMKEVYENTNDDEDVGKDQD